MAYTLTLYLMLAINYKTQNTIKLTNVLFSFFHIIFFYAIDSLPGSIFRSEELCNITDVMHSV